VNQCRAYRSRVVVQTTTCICAGLGGGGFLFSQGSAAQFGATHVTAGKPAAFALASANYPAAHAQRCLLVWRRSAKRRESTRNSSRLSPYGRNRFRRKRVRWSAVVSLPSGSSPW